MPQIQRGTIAEDFRNGLDLDSARTGKYPNEASEKVVLTYDYSNARVANVLVSGVAANATSALIYATPTDADFYLTSASIAFIKDVTATSASSSITTVISGVTQSFLNYPQFTLTVQTGANSMVFDPPVKIDRGTNININNSTAVGNITSRASIAGYIVR